MSYQQDINNLEIIKQLLDSLIKNYNHNKDNPNNYISILSTDETEPLLMYSKRTDTIISNRRLETIIHIIKKVYNGNIITNEEYDFLSKYNKSIKPNEHFYKTSMKIILDVCQNPNFVSNIIQLKKQQITTKDININNKSTMNRTGICNCIIL